MWKKVLITPNTSIEEAINIIDRTALQIALVVDEDGKLLGTVTDGDIRRALLNHLNLDIAVERVMNNRPCFVYDGQPREAALLLMQSKRVRQIPVLTQDLRVVGMELADELLRPSLRDNWVVIMAGGLGRRLRPITESRPKPLLKVGDKPLLETMLESFIAQGFRQFYFSINYKAEMITQYFEDGARWKVNIQYLKEKQHLGTAGSLGLLPARPEKPMLLMNGDILTRANFGQLLEFHSKNLTVATACIKEQYIQIPYGVVAFENHRLQEMEEKPWQRYFINAGLYVLNPESLDFVPGVSYLDIPDLFRRLLDGGKEIAVFPIREYWIDIGRFEDYDRANSEFPEVFK